MPKRGLEFFIVESDLKPMAAPLPRITFRIQPDRRDALLRYCRENHLKPSALIRQAIETELKTKNPSEASAA